MRDREIEFSADDYCADSGHGLDDELDSYTPMGKSVSGNISNTRDSVSSGYPNTEKRVENTTRSGVFLTKFEVFG